MAAPEIPPDAPDAADDASAESIGDAELRALLARAKADGDEPLRRLVSSYVTLRRLSADVIELIETQFGGATVARAPLLTHVKRLTRRDR
jgi:hypothetical protein